MFLEFIISLELFDDLSAVLSWGDLSVVFAALFTDWQIIYILYKKIFKYNFILFILR